MNQSEPTIAVPEFDSVRAEAIPDWVFASTEPLVLRGLVEQWPLIKLGQQAPSALIDKLQSHYCGQPAPVYFGDSATTRRLAYTEDGAALNFDIVKSDLNKVLEELSSADSLLPVRYIASNIIDYYFPGIRDDNDLNFASDYFNQNPLEGGDPLAGIWIGNETISPSHYDAQNNIACCVAGRRKFTLFPPSQIANLYPGPLHLNPGGQAITMVDLDAPDFDAFPKYEHALAHKREVFLDPGDALFIPVMWWHQVASLSPFNVLINYWWNTFPKAQGQAMAVLEHALLSIRHRSAEEKQAWQAIFDYYVFSDTNTAVEHIPEHLQGPLAKLDETAARKLRAVILNKLNK